MEVGVIDCGSDKIAQITEMLQSLGAQTQTISLLELDEERFPASTPLVFSGNPSLLTDDDPFPMIRKYRWLKYRESAMLGLCFGHQLLGLLHGSRVFLINEDRENRAIYLQPSHPLFEGLSNPSYFQQDHCEAISLPDGFLSLASSDACTLEAMAHPEKPHFGVQFHPEVSGENGRQLFGNFLKIAFPG
ncbi:MAG: type 1 glutamine amidotransferase [Salibacteraceae bacterium]